MNIEIFGDKSFIKSVKNSDGVWVLMAGRTVYAIEAENGNALPVWVTKEQAEKFAEKLPGRSLSPIFVPLSNFTGAGWLESKEMKLVEVLASPVHGCDPLVYTASEFRAIFKT